MDAQKQREELEGICASAFADDSDANRLAWAVACVRSRNFALSESVFACVPFVDMLNHSEAPNAQAGTQEIGALDNGVLPEGSFQVIATSPIQKGDEITIW